MLKWLSFSLLLAGSLCGAQTTATRAIQTTRDTSGAAYSDSALPDQQEITDQTKTFSDLPSGAASALQKSTQSEAGKADNKEIEGAGSAPKVVLPPLVRSDFEIFVDDASGRPLDAAGRPLDASGRPLNTAVQALDAAGRPLDASGRPLNTAVQALDATIQSPRKESRSLPVFGRDLFSVATTTFAPISRVPVPADYVLGPGDQLVIRVWGMVDFQYSAEIDRNGQIALPKVGVLSVAGLHYEQINGFLRTAIGRIYKNFELNVTMGQLRSIQVYILGQVRQPGLYTVSSMSTLVNALFASGGPNGTGSMRRIQLRRADQVVTEFDLYDLQQKGDKSRDVKLLPGDVIFIPPVGEQIAVVGNVNQPAIYELKEKTTVADVIRGAGGLTDLASTDIAILERIEDHHRKVDQIALNAEGMQREIHGGDILRIFPISPKYESAITLRGNVPLAGRFPWHEGMRVSDLIPDRNTLITREHWQGQNHQAENAHTDILTSLDVNSAEVNWDYASIERLDMSDLSTRLIPFNLAAAIDHPESQDNVRLKSGDVITIFSRKDLALPMDKHVFFVRIGGEVGAPGIYRVKPGDKLRDILRQAGGVTPHSFLYGTVLTRTSTRKAQVEQLNKSILNMKRELMATYSNSSQNTATSNTQGQAAQLQMQQSLISQLSEVQPTGRIVLNLKTSARNIEDLPDMTLEDGDTIAVPARLDTVQVVGSVYNENAFRYDPRKSVAQYLHDAGSVTRNADKSHIYILRADGSTVSSQSNASFWKQSMGKTKLLPGDAIVVPVKIRIPNYFWQNLAPVAQILTTAATTGVLMGSVM